MCSQHRGFSHPTPYRWITVGVGKPGSHERSLPWAVRTTSGGAGPQNQGTKLSPALTTLAALWGLGVRFQSQAVQYEEI